MREKSQRRARRVAGYLLDDCSLAEELRLEKKKLQSESELFEIRDSWRAGRPA
jgi:hypothetical protein